MPIFLINIFSLLAALLAGSFSFNDAGRALAEGVFSTASVAGYSVQRSIIMYLVYILSGVVAAGVYALIKRRGNETGLPQECDAFPQTPRVSKREKIFVACVALLFVACNIVFQENILDARNLHSEEFYNLATLQDYREAGHFDLVYPYSFGNIAAVSVLRSLGIGLVYYKIFLTILAVVVLYWLIAFYVSGWKKRAAFFIFFIILYLQVFISPTLHRNMLRFLIPVFLLVCLQKIFDKQFSSERLRLFFLAVLIAAVFFFSSADITVVSAVIYALYVCALLYSRTSGKTATVFVAGPLLALFVLAAILGQNIYYFFRGQILSVISYSGYVNAAPYFNPLTIFDSGGMAALVRNGLNVLIFYLPLLAMLNLLVFFFINFRKNNYRPNTPAAHVFFLTAAYFIYYRQNFGDAGAGRITIVSIILFFIGLIIYSAFERKKHAVFILSVIGVFFASAMVLSLYFLRYNILDLYNNKTASVVSGVGPCPERLGGASLVFAGYDRCDIYLSDELLRLEKLVAGNKFYVFDDTFTLYYLFNSRPVVIAPSYSMDLSGQNAIIKKISELGVNTVIYPRVQNFFGVSESALGDKGFMAEIKSYIKRNFVESARLPHFIIYSRK